MKTFLKTGVLLVSIGALAASPDPAIYQYWFDRNESSKKGNTYPYDDKSNPLTIDASGLSEGGHAVSYRMADKDNRWGSVLTRYFVVPSAKNAFEDPGGAVTPTIYQYWFDEDVSSRIANTKSFDGDTGSVSIDASGLSEGGHAVKFRMANSANQWGSVLTRYFVVKSEDKEDPKDFTEPVMYQYWFDNDESSRVKGTAAFSSQPNPFSVDASGLSEGGHALNYRMANKKGQWGSVMSRYFVVPSENDKSTSKPKAYRVCINDDVIASGTVPNDSSFTVTPDFPENPVLTSIKSREFKYLVGEGNISMDATGSFSCALQMLSENNEWGAPLYSEISHSVTTKLSVDSVPVPYDHTFAKPDGNNFKAYRFYNRDNSCLYFKASQDCVLVLYQVSSGYESNLSRMNTLSMSKGETYKYETSSLNNRQLVAIVYDTPKNKNNSDDEVFLRIMYEDNKLPKPVIKLDSDTWELTITCADQRATIYYTLDGSDPNRESPVYTGPILLDRFTRVKAYAVYGDLADSNVEDIQFSEKNMQIPRPKLEYVGGPGMNEFIFTNRVEGVTTYYVIGNGDVKDETQRKVFDGKPIEIEDGATVKAYCVKDQLADSEMLSVNVYHSDYVTRTPYLNNYTTTGEDFIDYTDIKNMIMLYVPDGTAKYRIVKGKQEFAYGQEIDENEWTEYDGDWLELPGGAFSGNLTVQVFAEAEGKARSAVTCIYTDWVKAVKPKTDYDNYRLKLSSAMPGGIIKYSVDAYNPQNALEYKPDNLPDGIDFKEISSISAWMEAEGYTDSDIVTVSVSDYDMARPVIQYEEDGYLHITHDMEGVDLVVSVEPEQELETIASNHLRFIPEYNTRIEAYAKKKGYNDSGSTNMNPVSKPTIFVNGYDVIINYSYGEVYYTTDGSKPTKNSTLYEGEFESKAATIRAVCFSDGEIPAEADPVKVMDQANAPQMLFNFAKASNGSSKDSKKMKFTSSTPGSQIYYALDATPTESTRKLFDPSVDADGVDVGDAVTVYAYAEAEGFRRSDIVSRNTSEGYLNPPSIKVNDGVVEISHTDPSVTIVPEFNPVQEYEYVHNDKTNTVTCSNVVYNTTVKAYVTKSGHIESEDAMLTPISRPVITVDGYYVEISYSEADGQTVYYTVDGSTPTKLSSQYTGGFETSACTVRAVAFQDGMIPSEAEPAKVMDQAAMPEIDINNGFAKLSSSTPGATIYYSIDQGISTSNRQTYDPANMPDGIDINNARTLYAYAEAEGYRRSETLDFFKSNYTLSEPTLTYSDGYVIAEHEDSGVTIRFTDDKGNALQPEANNPRRVKVAYNSVVDAYSYKKGYVASKSVRIQPTDMPEITADLFTVTIKVKPGQTVRYTIDGSLPNNKSTEYESPFTVKETCTIRAVAFADGMIPAEGNSLSITYRKSAKPEIKDYDGRYLTLSAETGSSIRYVVGEGKEVSQGSLADGKIDLGGINEIKAIAQRRDAEDSDVFTYKPAFYANETDAYTTQPGVLKEAFGWCTDMSDFESLSVHGPLVGASAEDMGDYEFLRSISSLKHLDLKEVNDSFVPDGALDADNLITVVMPAKMNSAGSNVFGESNGTLCSIEIPGDGIVPDHLLSGICNSNLLLYVRNLNNVSTAIANSNGVVGNVVVLGGTSGSNRSESVSLTHAKPFHAPKEFSAQRISFTRSFTKETELNGASAGWETMNIPFDVQSIECAGKVIKPFGVADTERGECPFWLFRPADTEWYKESSILANTPYLLAMPNNPLYADEFVVKGDVTFSSSNVIVPITPATDEMTFSFGVGHYLAGNYSWIDKEEDVLAINETAESYLNRDFKPGGIFLSGRRNVAPFECYVIGNGAKGIPVFDESEVDEIFGETGIRVWSESYDICIRSSISMKARIYDTVGQLIRIVDVKAGETVRVQDITPGIYFVGSTKILVKK